MPALLIITDGLIPSDAAPDSGLCLHPALSLWQGQLQSRSRRWFACADRTPLDWYAAAAGTSPAGLLANRIGALPEHTCQCWVASPFHTQLGRDRVHVLAEAEFPWCEEDAEWLCALLNPLLQQQGMHLLAVGAAMLLACEQALDAHPASFAAIAGHLLPDRHPEGVDDGRLARLLAEIQMLLFQHPAAHRRARGEVDVNGIWFWGATEMPDTTRPRHIATTTSNPVLRSLTREHDARLMISEAGRLPALLGEDRSLPPAILLAGHGHAVLLTKSIWPKFGKHTWRPVSVESETSLLVQLEDMA
ncbi:MAG: threonine synthase [Mariprofundaceae bacterium]|nr:threonine synthase [Mariprofundaceae bacterium]